MSIEVGDVFYRLDIDVEDEDQPWRPSPDELLEAVITQFVVNVTEPDKASFVATDDHVEVIKHDGWVEHKAPVWTQVMWLHSRTKLDAIAHELKNLRTWQRAYRIQADILESVLATLK